MTVEDGAVGGVVVDHQDAGAFVVRRLHFEYVRGRLGRFVTLYCEEEVDPTPAWLSTQTKPPISSTSCLLMASPRPVPPESRGGGVHLAEGLKEPVHAIFGDANAGVAHGELQAMTARSQRLAGDLDEDFAGFGEFDAVAHQVEQHLTQPRHVAHNHGGVPSAMV
ncbi:MAG: hypothetical protein R2856_13875 [Caldilineaceae bacterium]